MGATNGLGQSSVAFFRSVGPYMGGTMVQWGINNNKGFPFNYVFPFIVMAIMSLLLLALSTRIPVSFNKPWKDRSKELTK